MRVQVAMPKLPCMSDVRVFKARYVDRSGFFGIWWFEDTTPMSMADVVLVVVCACTREVLERCRVFVLSASGGFGGRRPFSAVSLFWVLASRPALLNCRRFFAVQLLLERGCVWLGGSCLECHALPWTWVRTLGVPLMKRFA